MKKNGLLGQLEMSYAHHPRLIWITLLAISLLFILVQSYFASPRELTILFKDSLLPLFVVLTGIFLLIFVNNTLLLVFGVFYILLTLVTYFTEFIPKPYGTFFFLYGVWLLVDWYNYRTLKKSIFYELVNGNYYIAFGIILASFIFGLITELVNLPFMIWSYSIPLPSLESFGIPSLVAAFGWTPWVLSMFAIFYPFTFKKPKR